MKRRHGKKLYHKKRKRDIEEKREVGKGDKCGRWRERRRG